MPKIENGNHIWLKEHFEPQCPIRSTEEFAEKVSQRQKRVEKLPADVVGLRHEVRKTFGIDEEAVWTAYGEQPCGLNEPPLVLGKRVLGAYMSRNYGWKLLDYSASSDVVGSEAGMYRAELPYPYDKTGVHNLSVVSGAKFTETPALRVSTKEVDFKDIVARIIMVYGEGPAVHDLIGQMYLEYVQKEQSLATAQNKLQGNLEQRLGLKSRKSAEDINFDSHLAQIGGLNLILSRWEEIVATSHKYANHTTRIPDSDEAPFYAYPQDVGIRPRIWFEDGSKTKYVATHPYDRGKVFGRFTDADIMEGRVGITFRAIPRVILMSSIFDAHITGGGAKYNGVAKGAYEELFQVPYFVIAHMDLAEENGEEKGIFQYKSHALRKGEKAPGYKRARDLVIQGKIAMLDLAASLIGNEREVINQVLKQDNLSMNQRIDLSQT